jgi:hypothetical protein
MAPVAIDLVERRRERRHSGAGSRWQTCAVLRPGQPVTLINICSHAALVESAARLRPGARTEMQMAGPGKRESLPGRLERCYVSALEPLRYRGVLMFDQCIDLGIDAFESRE